MIGQRVLDDPRNSLVLDFVRIVKELDAKSFVFENVKGLTVGRQKAFLHELVEAFTKAGYDISLPWKVLDAADYGVPQHRQRLILMGVKKGMSAPSYPLSLTQPADRKKQDSSLPIGPTCADAIGDLPNADLFASLNDSDTVKTNKFKSPSPYAAELRGLSNDAWHYGYMREWDSSLLTCSARTEHTDISRRRFGETLPGMVEPISRFFKLSPKGLSNTLRAGTDGARGAFTSPRPIHYQHNRCITAREMARLHGFPDWFRVHATKWHGARQIGNSVPPPLGRAVALQMMKALKIKPSRPSLIVSLGDLKLLYMDMSEASRYFGVAALNGRRDRKSGAKKRKQHEIEAELQSLRLLATG